MAPRIYRSSQDYELVPRSSNDSFAEFHGHSFTERSVHASWLTRLLYWPRSPASNSKTSAAYSRLSGPRRRRRGFLAFLYWLIVTLPYFVAILLLFVVVFLPSYTHRPAHYEELRGACLRSNAPGRANVNNEKVFIAASIYEQDGTLTGGAWGKAVLDLVDLLGPDNVYLSIYENDPDQVSEGTLSALGKQVTSNSTVLSEHLPFDSIAHITLPSGEKRLKRIAFLAEVRNRALRPLETSNVIFDKLLFINDVIFDPIEAVQLLFATNVDADGRTQYGAACSVDFINPFKFYDRFATRDQDGYSMGIPFYPWFTDAGASISRRDVLEQKDAVRVRSCWGGMTAFEAKWFQVAGRHHLDTAITDPNSTADPLRFRFEEDIFWDSSECCLIHADLQYRRGGKDVSTDAGIYMNPYIRVAYDEQTLSWLALTRRPERLYSIAHNILNHLVGLPGFNPRRAEEPGETVTDQVWKYGDPNAALSGNATSAELAGSYQQVQRVAGPGGFCGGRKLLLINEHPKNGESNWINLPIPVPQHR